MGSANAMGHVTVAVAAGGADALWDLIEELCRVRSELSGIDTSSTPGVHGFTPAERAQLGGDCRYCVHPTGTPDVEFRSDDLEKALMMGALWLADQIPEDHLWRRD